MANSTAGYDAQASALSTEVELGQRQQRRTAPMDKETAHLLMRIYASRRVDYQIQFYQSRILEFDGNSEMMFRLTAIVMSLSTILAALSMQADSSLLRLMTAMLPALAALVSAFRQLYQWERQAAIYRDSILGLEEARLVMPDMDVLDPATAYLVYPELVKRAEQVFQDEVNQWGQVAGGKPSEEADLEAIKLFAEEFKLDILKADGSIDDEKIGMLRDILESGQGGSKESISIEVPQRTSLPAGRGSSRKKTDTVTDDHPATDDSTAG
jgi:hypothetical protein